MKSNDTQPRSGPAQLTIRQLAPEKKNETPSDYPASHR